MNKKKRLFSKFVQKWVGRIWVGWWHIDVCYYKNKDYARIEHHKIKRAMSSVATCHTKWEYLEAVINVNEDTIKKLSKEELEYCVVHELMHILLNEMREQGIEHEERTATLLARSFISCIKSE